MWRTRKTKEKVINKNFEEVKIFWTYIHLMLRLDSDKLCSINVSLNEHSGEYNIQHEVSKFLLTLLTFLSPS